MEELQRKIDRVQFELVILCMFDKTGWPELLVVDPQNVYFGECTVQIHQ